ncbi:hypothetical protein PtA15_1A436 [Puccinia triticina]|uniref:Uncharacterized protein n=1 Tax=Puccinia triticina TaxID=208348 RepID=A0ABY7C7F1_9BASI|nr:uncharacterized protein PtA15_1A436 [Puccinia triticina]WAQ81098.1 hypothetical protein PtA15_1A436 [Puccinia triticina]
MHDSAQQARNQVQAFDIPKTTPVTLSLPSYPLPPSSVHFPIHSAPSPWHQQDFLSAFYAHILLQPLNMSAQLKADLPPPSYALIPSSFRKKSEATHTTPDSPELAERNRFLDLHAGHKDAAQLFGKLLDTAGLEKVREHNNQLASVFRSSDLSTQNQGTVSYEWRHFTQGRKGSLDHLKEELELTDEADRDKINTLIRRAHFVRFPEVDASTLKGDQMLAALDGSTASAANELKPVDSIQWAADIVRRGFDAEYQRHDVIVAPTLEKLQSLLGPNLPSTSSPI